MSGVTIFNGATAMMPEHPGQVLPKHGKLIYTGKFMRPESSYGEVLRCPWCGHEADLDNFDVLGADEGNVFCNGCNAELET